MRGINKFFRLQGLLLYKSKELRFRFDCSADNAHMETNTKENTATLVRQWIELDFY